MVWGLVAGAAVDFAKKIGDHFWPAADTPEQRSEKEAKILEIQALILARDAERDTAILTAQRDIMVAELKQDDKFTKRTRPIVIYSLTAVVILHTIANYIVMPMLGRVAVPLPVEVWTAYSGLLSVYFVGRTTEKRRFLQMGAGKEAPPLLRMITGNAA